MCTILPALNSSWVRDCSRSLTAVGSGDCCRSSTAVGSGDCCRSSTAVGSGDCCLPKQQLGQGLQPVLNSSGVRGLLPVLNSSGVRGLDTSLRLSNRQVSIPLMDPGYWAVAVWVNGEVRLVNTKGSRGSAELNDPQHCSTHPKNVYTVSTSILIVYYI